MTGSTHASLGSSTVFALQLRHLDSGSVIDPGLGELHLHVQDLYLQTLIGEEEPQTARNVAMVIRFHQAYTCD
ncbi:MAG: hypothetical protein IH951_14510 [Bacteroidetes bacterium]|nr:hypothetical protein [Bacteroidota bacterium]